MGGIGWHNPLPFQVGGGETDTETIWRGLRSVVGEGGCGPEHGLEDSWRQVKAQAIAADAAAIERAMLQGIPGKQTDHLEVYEDLLGLARAATETERQSAVAAAITAQISADVPTLRARLQAIDPALDVENVAYANATTTHFGKAFGPRTGGPAYGSGQSSGIHATGWPNYASDFVLHVRYTLPSGATIPPADVLAAARRMLNEALPAFVDFEIYTSTGFYLDGGVDGTSLLDLTAFD